MSNYITPKEAAKMYRPLLKEAFPGVKFSVRMWGGSGSSVCVEWTDGPSEAEVDNVVGFLIGQQSDYNGECWSSVAQEIDGEQVQYIGYSNDYTRNYSELTAAAVNDFLLGEFEVDVAPLAGGEDFGLCWYDGEIHRSNPDSYHNFNGWAYVDQILKNINLLDYPSVVDGILDQRRLFLLEEEKEQARRDEYQRELELSRAAYEREEQERLELERKVEEVGVLRFALFAPRSSGALPAFIDFEEVS